LATSRKRALLFIAVPLIILLLPFTIYVIDSAAASDKVARNVTVAGVDVSRLTEDDALAAVSEYAEQVTSTMTTVVVNGKAFPLDPASVGLTFDTEGAVEAAMKEHKDGMTDWIRAFSQQVDVPVEGHIDEDMLEVQLRAWELEAISEPAFDGSVAIVNGRVEFEYPAKGEAIDREVAKSLLNAALVSGAGSTVDLPTTVAEPSLTRDDIDAAVGKANRILSTPVILTNEEFGFELAISEFNIGRSLSARVVRGNPSTVEFSFDKGVFVPIIEAKRSLLELEPADAYWEQILVDDHAPFDENYKITDSPQKGVEGLPDDDVITLVPSRPGTSIDPDAVADAVVAAAEGDGTGELPIIKGTPAEFTTEMAESYGTLYEVSEFTTYTPGTNRVHNIHLMADIVDGTIVWPGETFSVNQLVGRRTLEKGFKYDCAIVSGELSCEQDPVNVGGGVSQFGTTIFNAIYFGCYKDVTHTPHSIYFSKYPEGREATLGYPYPDVAFENDSEAPVIIRTSYTKRSITVTFFGNQNGIHCTTERSGRSEVSSPVLEYQADEDGVVAPGEEKVKSKGSSGWYVENYRIFVDEAGNEIKRETFPWRYRGEKNVILLHPCDERVGGDGDCPIVVPTVVGMDQATATATLQGLGFTVNVVFVDSDEAHDGLVVSQNPSTGWLEAGTAITINVGSYLGP